MNHANNDQPDTHPTPHVVLTGANGCIGSVLQRGLLQLGYNITGMSRSHRPNDYDRERLTQRFRGRHAIVHLAWSYATDPRIAAASYAENLELNRTVLRAARDANVPRVLIASSVHADYFYDHPIQPPDPADPNDQPPLISPNRSPRGNGPYGCAKVIAEQDAHAVAATGLDVACIRFGAVTTNNQPHPTDPWEQRVFLDHADLLALTHAILHSPVQPGRCTTLFAVSNNHGRVHDTVNPFGWQPKHPD